MSTAPSGNSETVIGVSPLTLSKENPVDMPVVVSETVYVLPVGRLVKRRFQPFFILTVTVPPLAK